MSLAMACPRCREPVERVGKGARCPVHGTIPALWLPREPSYEEFAEHLRVSADFPTYLPWPMSPGWAVTEFGVVTARSGRPMATITCCSGTSELDGPVDAFVVAEEAGVGLGARCAGLPSDDPGAEVGEGPPPVKVRIGSQAVPLWPVSLSGTKGEFDRSVVVGEAAGRWLWLALRPASAMLLLRDDWILRDVSGVGAPLVEMPFGGVRPSW
ncbi:MAG TPA: DUF6758 family protein [Nocardioides sp.]|nr:DUF6758 family protein [Nocardioides sp.]